MAEYTIKFILDEVKEKCVEELKLYNANVPEIKNEIPI